MIVDTNNLVFIKNTKSESDSRDVSNIIQVKISSSIFASENFPKFSSSNKYTLSNTFFCSNTYAMPSTGILKCTSTNTPKSPVGNVCITLPATRSPHPTPTQSIVPKSKWFTKGEDLIKGINCALIVLITH